jgi:hypothetical protein
MLMYVFTYVCIHVRRKIRVYICIYVCMYVVMYVYVHAAICSSETSGCFRTTWCCIPKDCTLHSHRRVRTSDLLYFTVTHALYLKAVITSGVSFATKECLHSVTQQSKRLYKSNEVPITLQLLKKKITFSHILLTTHQIFVISTIYMNV